MKLILQIKLLPNEEQKQSLLNTIKISNSACNKISEIAWNNQEFNQYRLHHIVYHPIKDSFNLSAQMVVRLIAKVVDAYKLDRKTKRFFKPFGAITYDTRILSYSSKSQEVSIWSVNGRLKIPFVCHRPDWIPFIKGEADLITRKGKFFLLQTVEVSEDGIKDFEEFLGVDMGEKDIATTSDGINFNSDNLNHVRDKYFKVRKSVQIKGTKGCKKLLKRLKGREQRFATITNHTISKKIVKIAKDSNRGIAIENLTHIIERTTVRKSQRRRHHSWAFFQLRNFLEYKAKLRGVLLVAVNPRYTSQICNVCHHFGNRNGKRFECQNCGNIDDADVNAAKNIAQLGGFYKQSRKDVNMLNLVSHIPLNTPSLAAE
jgi:IS605 OrfB family transposase